MEHLGHARLHTRSLAGSENDDVDCQRASKERRSRAQAFAEGGPDRIASPYFVIHQFSRPLDAE
jgi:hypothetical protein